MKVSKLLVNIVNEMMEGEITYSALLKKLHPNFIQSGHNLIHYLILRSKEIREAQEYLHHVGLSSLTNSESHTLSQVQQVLAVGLVLDVVVEGHGLAVELVCHPPHCQRPDAFLVGYHEGSVEDAFAAEWLFGCSSGHGPPPLQMPILRPKMHLTD